MLNNRLDTIIHRRHARVLCYACVANDDTVLLFATASEHSGGKGGTLRRKVVALGRRGNGSFKFFNEQLVALHLLIKPIQQFSEIPVLTLYARREKERERSGGEAGYWEGKV